MSNLPKMKDNFPERSFDIPQNYKPPVRDAVPYTRPKDVVPNPIDVIQSFFGESVNERTAQAVRELPFDQAEVLMEQLNEQLRNTQTQLFNRQDRERKFPAPDGYDHLLAPELHTHEEVLLWSNKLPSIATARSLKHMLLYCDRAVAWDPTGIYAFSQRSPEEWLPELANGVSQLLPIANSVQAGHLVLARTLPLELSQRNFTGLLVQSNVGFQDNLNVHLLDRAVEKHPNLLPLIQTALERARMFRDDGELMRCEPQISDALLEEYPIKTSKEKLLQMVVFTAELHTCNLSPIVTDVDFKNHILQGSRLALNSDSELTPQRALTTPVSYQIPDLSEVTFTDIYNLRQDEAVFQELRTALSSLSAACATVDEPGSIQAYRDFIVEYAGDIVRPSFEALQKLQRRAQIKYIASKLVARTLTFGLNDFIEHTGDIIRAGDPLIGRKSKRRMQNAKLACKILKTIS